MDHGYRSRCRIVLRLASAGQQQMSENLGDKTLGAAEQSAAPEIVTGMKFSISTGNGIVTNLLPGERVCFEIETRSGPRDGTLPLALFQRMVAGESASCQNEPPPGSEAAGQQIDLDEFDPEELADQQRLESLYRSLPEGDRIYVVERGDRERGLESPRKRLDYKGETAARQRRRRMWTIFALIPAMLFSWWISGLLERDRERNNDSHVPDILRDHSKNNPILKSAIDEADEEYRKLIESQSPESDERY